MTTLDRVATLLDGWDRAHADAGIPSIRSAGAVTADARVEHIEGLVKSLRREHGAPQVVLLSLAAQAVAWLDAIAEEDERIADDLEQAMGAAS